MAELPTNEFVETRNGGYYVRGTRIPLENFVYALRRGATAQELFESYPGARLLENVFGAIAFIEEHPDTIERYLQDVEALWEKFRREHPIPEEMRLRLERAQKDRERRSA